jgi:cytochrome c oxidase cbb3-type subunit 2
MPNYPWLNDNILTGADIAKKLSVLRTLGHPYTDEQIASAAEEVKGKTEMEALIAYLQSLGLALKDKRS